MSAIANSPKGGEAKPPDPGGGPRSRQEPGTWKRRDANNTPQPGVYRLNRGICPTWAGIAAGAAKNQHELHNDKGVITQTICVHLTRDSNQINYNLNTSELEYLLYDCIGLEYGKLVWCDRSFFRTLVFGVEESVDTKKLALGISHTIRKGLRSKAVRPVASEVNLKIFWTQYGASTSEITESLNHFGKVIGEFKNQTFPETRKDGKPSRMAGVKTGDLIVSFKPERPLPTYILVGSKKLKVHYDGQTNTCPRCYRFPVALGMDDSEACPGRGNPTLCAEQDPKGSSYKYDFDSEWKKLINSKPSKGSIEDNLIGDSGFGNEDKVELNGIQENATKQEVRNWIEDKGIKMTEIPDDNFEFDQDYPTKISISGLDGELANELKEKCWGRFMGQGQSAKKVYVDLVRMTKKQEDNESVSDGEFQEANEENDPPLKPGDIVEADLITDDEMEDEITPPVEALCKDNETVEDIITQVLEKRDAKVLIELADLQQPEGGSIREDIKVRLMGRNLTAQSLEEVCEERGIEPDESQRKKLHNLVRQKARKKTKDNAGTKRNISEIASPGVKKSPEEKKTKVDKQPKPTAAMLELLKKSQNRSPSRSPSRGSKTVKGSF